MDKPDSTPAHPAFSPEQSGFMTNACLTAGFMVSGMVSGLSKAYAAGGKDIGMAQVSAAEALVELAIRSEHLLRAIYADREPPGIYDYEVSEEVGEWFAGYLVEHGNCPPQKEAHAKLNEMMEAFFRQGQTQTDSDEPASRAPDVSAQTVIYCFTGDREASAFRLGDLAATTGLPLEDFLSACEDRVETIDEAIRSAPPLLRSSCEQNHGDHATALHNLKLVIPGGLTIDDLLTRMDETNGSQRSFHMRVR
jgi:hypothetical protein